MEKGGVRKMQERNEPAGMSQPAGNVPWTGPVQGGAGPEMPGMEMPWAGMPGPEVAGMEIPGADMPWNGQAPYDTTQPDRGQPYMGSQGAPVAGQAPHPVGGRIVRPDDHEKRAGRFQVFGLGCFLYALFYTCCLYHNASGITYPFFAGGTLWFFISYIKKSGSSSADGRKQIDNRFLMACILIAGSLNCATDSGVLLFFNKLLMFALLGVLLLQCWHDTVSWSLSSYAKGLMFLVLGGIDQIGVPIGDWRAWRRTRKEDGVEKEALTQRRRIGKAVCIGLLIALPMAMFILLLLASADEVFGSLLLDLLEFPFYIDIWNGAVMLFETLIIFVVSYGIFAYNTDPQNKKTIDDIAAPGKTSWDPYIAVTVNAVMCLIYVVFSGIQIFSLFLGNLPEGYTYSSYARRGFFELMFVCVFNVFLVLFTLAYFEKTRTIRLLLAVICGCTYIMIVSSAFRMLMYIKSYQLTFLRISVLWVLLMTAVVMAGVLWYIYHPFPLFKFMLMVLTVGWLSFSALHPDHWIALYNTSMDEDFDRDYLMDSLSLDAVPALPEDICRDISGDHYREAKEYREDIGAFMGVRKFNFSRAYAARRIFGNR